MRLSLLLGVALLGACRAPAPCAADDDCASNTCLNGGCLALAEADARAMDLGPDATLDAALDAAFDAASLDMTADAQPPDATADAAVDMAPRDAEIIEDRPDMPCELPELAIDRIEQLAPIARGESYPFQVRTDPGVPFEVDAPWGAFQIEENNVVWAPRGGSPGDLPWPWWTGGVVITVTTGQPGCEVSTRFEVRVMGDILIPDEVTGEIWVLGSGGELYGTWVQVPGNGVTALAIASRASRDLIAGVRQVDANGRHVIHRLDAEGAIAATFDSDDFLTGAELLANPARAIFVDAEERVVAAGGGEEQLPFWTLDGRLERRLPLGGTLSVLVRRAGLATYGVQERPELITVVGPDRTRRLGDTGVIPTAAYQRLDPAELLLVSGADSRTLLGYQDDEFVGFQPPPQGTNVQAVTPFKDGYLIYDGLNRRLRSYDERLRSRFDPLLERPIPAISVGGLLWLDWGRFPR